MSQKLDRDPYLFPDIDVLSNLLGIRDAETLTLHEDAFADTAVLEIERFLHHQKINFRLWRNIHKALFKEVYSWAGQIRTVNMTKGNSTFAQPEFIESNANRIFNDLAKKKDLQGLPFDDFASELAKLYNELNALHPFREGNGRSLKILITEIAARAGYTLDWHGMTPEENEVASAAGFYGDDGPLTDLFKKLLKNT